jgi:hypothetical protein
MRMNMRMRIRTLLLLYLSVSGKRGWFKSSDCNYDRISSLLIVNPQDEQKEQEQPLRVLRVEENRYINAIARKMIEKCPPEVRERLQGEVDSWPEERKT